MQRLPPLTAGSSDWSLPLAPHSADRLLEVLLSDSAEQRMGLLKTLLRGEPSLSLWVVCRAPRFRCTAPQGIGDLACWLSASALDVLRWSDEPTAVDQADDAFAAADGWAELAAAGVGVASLAERLAADKPQAAFVFLCGLLHGSRQWLECSVSAVSGTEQQAEQASTACLPDWLSLQLRAIEADGKPLEPDHPAALVRSALQQWQQIQPAGRASSEAVDSEATRQALDVAAEARQRWRTATTRRQGVLPELTGKLARLQQLETDFQAAVEHAKLSALQAFAYGASHEINNPLANISTRAQALLRDEGDPERRRKLATINSQAFRAHEMISDMMLFAKPPRLEPKAVHLDGLIDAVLAEMADEAGQQGTIMSRSSADQPLVIEADPEHLAVALKALCTNALEALAMGGRIEIAARAIEEESVAAGVELVVRDNGPGIPPEVRPHLFDPYFSGREAGRGLGLGLSKCWRIVEQHGGRMKVLSGGPGATFVLHLPQRATACPRPAAVI